MIFKGNDIIRPMVEEISKLDPTDTDSSKLEKVWQEVISYVNSLNSKGDQWIFRALKRSDVKFKEEEQGKGVLQTFDVSVYSSFDKAWDSRWRGVEKSVPERYLYEASMLHEFKRAAYQYRINVPKSDDFLEWFALARHYGMPSRLVDFTYSFYVASYFALSGKHDDAFVLAVNLKWLKEEAEKKLGEWFKTDFPYQKDWDFKKPEIFRRFAFVLKPDWVAPVSPFRLNERQINQLGLFLCPGNIERPFEDILIDTLKAGRNNRKLICLDAKLRTTAIRDLRRMNVDMRVMYPDLSGFAQSLRDLVHMDYIMERRKELELEESITAETLY